MWGACPICRKTKTTSCTRWAGQFDPPVGTRNDGCIAEAPSSSSPLRRRVSLAGAAVVGAAAVGLGWLFLGTGDLDPSALGRAPGIPPPDYAYLDNARVALYLGQLQGGLARSEQLTQQLTQSRNAGVSASALSLGGSTGSSSAVERVVTPTATARFYQLLDLLDKNGYLHTIDASASPQERVRAFAEVPEGTFVRLRRCALRLPSYVRLARTFGTGGYVSASNAYSGAGQRPPVASNALGHAMQLAGKAEFYLPHPPSIGPAGAERRLADAVRALAKKAGRNPRVPLSTCSGKVALRPRGVDLLLPIRLAALSSEPALLAGPVTVVGKLVRSVRPGHEYVDEASLATFADPVSSVDAAAGDLGSFQLTDELDADASVLAPGAVIMPIAIYK
jgi:hypothetical protein